MSSFVKADGQKITIKFDKPLIGDITGLSPPLAIDTNIRVSQRAIPKYFGQIYTASNTYLTTNVPARAFDSSISTFWETRATLPQWIQCELLEPQVVKKFRYYSGTSYRIRAYKLEASNDEVVWTELWSGENANTTGWRDLEFTNEIAYKYYRWTISTQWTSGRIYVYELELYADIPIGQERAFTISGQQVLNVNDELIAGDYLVKSIEEHPTIPNAILLNLYELRRFHNVVGDLTVTYNEGLGTLQGSGGIVLGFTEIFTPLDLIAKPNQNPKENIEIADVTCTGLLQEVTKSNSYLLENIEIVDITATGILTNVDDL